MRAKTRQKLETIKKRIRGGASHPCPRCHGPSTVLTTRKKEDGVIERRRKCQWCHHAFVTHEEHQSHLQAVVR